MRTSVTLLFGIAGLVPLFAQPFGSFNLTFDPGSDLTIDSIYPGNGWQIGDPNKPVFDSAYSAPNALVTDTVSPYSIGPTCYAGFGIPVYQYGEWVRVSFQQRMDVDSGQAFGWLEYFYRQDSTWKHAEPGASWSSGVEYSGPPGVQTDSGFAYTGIIGSWSITQFDFVCIGAFWQEGQRGSVNDTMRFRFAFRGDQNTNGRDGWMIDNIHLEDLGCPGGIEERRQISLNTFPNPANTSITLDLGLQQGERYTLELVRADGALVLREQRRNTGTQTLDLSRFSDGPYLLRVITDTRQASERIIVEH